MFFFEENVKKLIFFTNFALFFRKYMKLIVMTQPDFFVEEDKILSTLFYEGMDLLHLYKPNSEPIFSERLLSLIPERFHKKIVVHEHFYLRNEFDLAAINLEDETDAPPSSYKGKMSCTCNNISNLADKDVKKRFQYILLNKTFTPDGYDISELERAASDGLINKKVFAMGGVTADNIALADKLDFGGVVVRTDLWSRFNRHYHTDYKELIQHFIKLKKIIG